MIRFAPIWLLFCLTSCQAFSWDGAADVLIPDQFTMGQGSSTVDTAGGYNGHSDIWEYYGEGESTYAALTWDLPSIQGKQGGMDRHTQRNLALLVEHLAEEEGLSVPEESTADAPEVTASVGPLEMNLREGVSLPSKEIFFGVLGAMLISLLFIRYKANAGRRRWS
jgi:hypothetical protein